MVPRKRESDKKPKLTADAVARWGVYGRNSTEDQAENETVQIQVDFLRRYAELNQLDIHDYYLDEGVSGASPFHERPHGARLLEDAKQGRIQGVLFYRVNRLGRRLLVV